MFLFSYGDVGVTYIFCQNRMIFGNETQQRFESLVETLPFNLLHVSFFFFSPLISLERDAIFRSVSKQNELV